MVDSRVWNHTLDCELNSSIDLSLNPNNNASYSSTGVDLSVVTVFNLYKDEAGDSCIYSLLKTASNAVIKNGLFVFNVSLDLSQENCSDLWISPFDSAYGQF